MLVLSRKQSQQIVVGRDIRITVVKIDRNQVRLGIEAPRGIAILRKELTAERGAADSEERSDHAAPAAARRGPVPRRRIDDERGATV
jgi:carbon storage regulator